MRADQLIILEPQWPYGPRISPTERSDYIQGIYSKTLANFDDNISYISQILGQKDVSELERLATAFFLTREFGASFSIAERTQRMVELKPHIRRSLAEKAMKDVDQILADHY